MIQQFNAPCNFNGMVSPFSFWISDEYSTGKDPLYFQKDWLGKVRGGILDPKISEGIIQIAKIAEKNKLSFEYLFGIAMNAALEKYNVNDNKSQNYSTAAESESISMFKDEDFDEDEDLDDGIDAGFQ